MLIASLLEEIHRYVIISKVTTKVTAFQHIDGFPRVGNVRNIKAHANNLVIEPYYCHFSQRKAYYNSMTA